jgi:hypothetical protein
MMMTRTNSLRYLTLHLGSGARGAGSGMALVLRSDGVVLPRGAGRRHGAPRQEPQEVVRRAPVQGLPLERLHASRRLAAARHH